MRLRLVVRVWWVGSTAHARTKMLLIALLCLVLDQILQVAVCVARTEIRRRVCRIIIIVGQLVTSSRDPGSGLHLASSRCCYTTTTFFLRGVVTTIPSSKKILRAQDFQYSSLAGLSFSGWLTCLVGDAVARTARAVCRTGRGRHTITFSHVLAGFSSMHRADKSTEYGQDSESWQHLSLETSGATRGYWKAVSETILKLEGLHQ